MDEVQRLRSWLRLFFINADPSLTLRVTVISAVGWVEFLRNPALRVATHFANDKISVMR